MSGRFLLDWAVMAVSLFNTIVALWLGLAVLLNAERRTWGIWLAGGGLLMGGAFFISHSAILGHDLYTMSRGVDFWWEVGWFPVVAAPFAWYVLMLWYAGFWDDRRTALHRRHRPWLLLALLLAAGFLGLLLFTSPLPTFWQMARLDLVGEPAVAGVPLVLLAYPVYIVLCIALSLDALARPGPSGRLMGELARRRARPWLASASLALLLVSLLVAGGMGWLALNAGRRSVYEIYAELPRAITWADLVIELLIGAAIALLGQAVVAYEVFTGRTLPRRGLARHWGRALILAAGYGLLVGWSLTIRLRPIYALLLTAMLMTLFYALLSWRSYVERERTIEYLRPFVASQHLYEHLLTPAGASVPELDVPALFHALCRDVLAAQVGYLIPLGPLAPLAGPPLSFPPESAAPPLPGRFVDQLAESPQLYRPLEPETHGLTRWAVPLWSERGLMGVLLLGEKRDGGLYSQEEMEIARASGERLVDALAGREMARRLMALQRQRLAQNQVADRRTRRALHDEILPQLHTAALLLSNQVDPGAEVQEALGQLGDVHRRISNLLREMPHPAAPELARQGLVAALQRVVQDEYAGAFDGVQWEIEPGGEQAARRVPPVAAEVLFYAACEAVRNAARHGRAGQAQRPLNLRIGICWEEGLELTVEDDGQGLSSASGTAAGGQGVALHSTMLAVVGGTLVTEERPGQGTRVRLSLPAGALA